MARYLTLALLMAALISTSILGGCATASPHMLAGEPKATPNLNARFPTLPPL